MRYNILKLIELKDTINLVGYENELKFGSKIMLFNLGAMIIFNISYYFIFDIKLAIIQNLIAALIYYLITRRISREYKLLIVMKKYKDIKLTKYKGKYN